MKNIPGKNGSRKLKLDTNIVPLKKHKVTYIYIYIYIYIYSVVAKATILAPVSVSFELNITICDSITSEEGPS